jgi:hypothetical protein
MTRAGPSGLAERFPNRKGIFEERPMLKKLVLPAVAALLLAGCAGPARVDVAAAGPYYDGYYDGYYGPFVDGYWGGDGAFWYQDGGHAWHRDAGTHFNHTGGAGFSHVHGSGVHRDH